MPFLHPHSQPSDPVVGIEIVMCRGVECRSFVNAMLILRRGIKKEELTEECLSKISAELDRLRGNVNYRYSVLRTRTRTLRSNSRLSRSVRGATAVAANVK